MDPRNTKAYRVGVVAICLCGTIINSVDRASLSVAAPFIIKEFHIDSATMGVALSAFFWTYVMGNVVGGGMADRYGSKRVLGWSAAIWSICSALTGFAQNITHVVLARLGVGLGEASSSPTTAKIFASNFPTEERGRAIGINSAGNRVGLAITPILMVFLITEWGWRVAFFATGIGSLAWVVLWYYCFRDLSEERAKDAGPKEKIKTPWKEIFTNRALLGIIVVKFTQDFLQWMFMTWVPGYLILGLGMSATKMGFYTTLAFAIAAIAQPGVGWFSDWLIIKGWSVNRARKTVQVGLQLMSATIIITGFSSNIEIAMFFMVLAISAESACAGHIWTIIADVVPGKLVGSVGGIINAIGAIAGIVSPIMTGVIFKITGSFQLALLIGGISILVASVFIIFVVPDLRIMELGKKIKEDSA